jgi:hypothetical protein
MVPTHVVERAAAANGVEPASEKHTDPRTFPSDAGPEPLEDIESLVVRVAASGERDSIAQLAKRAGSRPPAGALMVGELHGRLLAAVSLSSGESLMEPTASGAAVAAVLRYRVAHLGRRRGAARIAWTG